jgi:Rps23 Pro-64 3,4-dihydroxylase Tpa1-like proline 4-hydroxylase
MDEIPRGRLLELNPALAVPVLRAAFARDRRVQVRDVLTDASAHGLHRVLRDDTAWGASWQAGAHGPRATRHAALAAMSDAERDERAAQTRDAMRGGGYAFEYASYPLVEGYLQRWAPGGPHDRLLEDINSPPVLDFVRAVTGIPELVKADAQATLYAPGHFLAVHNDQNTERGRRVAYVLNVCAEEWRPDWGGYLHFYDADGDVIAGYRPRFNALNLFAVPQLHNVSFVPPFAPVARYAITGWFRDR